MIAAETTRTAAVIFPFRNVTELNIAHWTDLFAEAAVDADVIINRKLPVGYHEAIEIGTYHVTERPGGDSLFQALKSPFPPDDDILIYSQIFLRLTLFLFFTLRAVGIHEGQTDVAFGHHQRLTAMQHDSFCCQFLSEHLHGQPRAVSAGTQGECIVIIQWILRMKDKPADEHPYNMRRLPPMHGKAQSDTLVFRKRILTRRLQFIGYEKQPFTSGSRHLLSCPTGISCT